MKINLNNLVIQKGAVVLELNPLDEKAKISIYVDQDKELIRALAHIKQTIEETTLEELELFFKSFSITASWVEDEDTMGLLVNVSQGRRLFPIKSIDNFWEQWNKFQQMRSFA